MPAPLKLVRQVVPSWMPSIASPYSPLPSPETLSVHDSRTPEVPFPNGRPLTLAVVGAPGCGKTAFIKKAMKRRGLSVAETNIVEYRKKNISRFIHYTDRYAYISIILQDATGMVQTFFNATIIEINSSELINPKTEKPCGNGWPSCLPEVDGILVCYDASDRTSFTHVVELLGGFHSLQIPTMVLACKSDLERHITPKEAYLSVRKYAGIVEVTSKNEKGKAKMRRCVGAFVKMVQLGKETALREAVYQNPALPEPLCKPPAYGEPLKSPLFPPGFDYDEEDDRPVNLRGLSFGSSEPYTPLPVSSP